MAQKDNLVFIGMPGAGKSTVGVVVAKILGMDFVDADLLIQNRFGKTLQALIDEHGAAGFIALEDDVLQDIDCVHTVVSTGGSAVYSEAGMRHLQGMGTIVYLQVPLDELTGRLGGLAERGVVMRDEAIRDLAGLYAERVPLYEQWADVVVDTAGKDIRTVAEEVCALLSKH